jgi:glycosyltransferase involved in cell wall biosynthesis
LCVLASDIPENRELVEGAGFTFKKGDIPDLERMLGLLINEPGARNDAGRRAKQRIRDECLWEKVAAQVEQVYLDLYGGKELQANSHDSPTLCSELKRSPRPRESGPAGLVYR